MTTDDIRTAVLAALRRVAPEIDPVSLRTEVPIRDQVDLDSMDFLNFMVELHEAFGIDIPESAYKDVSTLDGCIAYVVANSPQAAKVKPGDR
ncbi:MAG TPA: acyl carrier protein [Gemmatimonadaceae bacterium]|nr:acyl carrier protein [Gemmatimonadaceae bacterium]